MRTPVLETKRLHLRTFQETDAEEVFYCWERDPEVAKYMMWESHNDIEKTKEFIRQELFKVEDSKWYRWCIEDKESGRILGTCLIFFNNESDCWDVSYNLGKKYWGKGYITEAMKAAMDFAIHTLGIHEFMTSHAIENPASGRVLKKLGFRYECEVPYICNGGKIHTTGKQYRLQIADIEEKNKRDEESHEL